METGSKIGGSADQILLRVMRYYRWCVFTMNFRKTYQPAYREEKYAILDGPPRNLAVDRKLVTELMSTSYLHTKLLKFSWRQKKNATAAKQIGTLKSFGKSFVIWDLLD